MQIKAMKNGKTAGLDNIPAEVLKVDPHATADILLPLFQDTWQKGNRSWNELRFLAADRQKWKELVDNLFS
jgi:hypothetical protein